MSNAVFIAKLDADYDDAVEERYHFPKGYLNRVQQAVGDWVVYYESRRGGGRMAYFAMARVLSISPDPDRADHFYAKIADYIEFPEPVPLRVNGNLLEAFLRNSDGTTNPGASINAVRLLPRQEFEAICRLGMNAALAESTKKNEATELIAETQAEYDGSRETRLTSRVVRDVAFARVVRSAYNRTCAMTGLQLINGGGRCEIEAAHIRPVENDGPDSPRNGLALSRTVHWLFDRGFLSVEDDGTILKAGKLVPDPVNRLLNPDGRIRLPANPSVAPHRLFLRWHRENKFKG